MNVVAYECCKVMPFNEWSREFQFSMCSSFKKNVANWLQDNYFNSRMNYASLQQHGLCPTLTKTGRSLLYSHPSNANKPTPSVFRAVLQNTPAVRAFFTEQSIQMVVDSLSEGPLSVCEQCGMSGMSSEMNTDTTCEYCASVCDPHSQLAKEIAHWKFVI
jgi:hypothetical protein